MSYTLDLIELDGRNVCSIPRSVMVFTVRGIFFHKNWQNEADKVVCNVSHTPFMFWYFRTPLINVQCQSMPIKIMVLIRNTSQCRSMPINADQNHGNGRHWSHWLAVIGNDRYWSASGSISGFWSVLIGIGHWYRESWYFIGKLDLTLLSLVPKFLIADCTLHKHDKGSHGPFPPIVTPKGRHHYTILYKV